MNINLEIRPFFPSHLLFPGPGNRLVSSRYQEDKFPPIILKQVQQVVLFGTANLFLPIGTYRLFLFGNSFCFWLDFSLKILSFDTIAKNHWLLINTKCLYNIKILCRDCQFVLVIVRKILVLKPVIYNCQNISSIKILKLISFFVSFDSPCSK